jgi:hypothetical protein
MFICENNEMITTPEYNIFYPDLPFIGTQKNKKTIADYIQYIEIIISKDHTEENRFLGEFNTWCKQNIKNGKLILVDGSFVGTKDENDSPVMIEQLLGQEDIHFKDTTYGIWIPYTMFLDRLKYQWFQRMNEEQILTSELAISKHMNHALNGTMNPQKKYTPDWISFWRVPATNNTLNLWGLMPMGLGNSVPRSDATGDEY